MSLVIMFVFSLRLSCHFLMASCMRNRTDTKWPTAKIDLQIPGRVPHTHTHAYATFIYVHNF